MSEITKKFQEGQCVYLASNPETKMTISVYEKRSYGQKELLTGYVWCNWLHEGEKKESKFHQDALTLCAE